MSEVTIEDMPSYRPKPAAHHKPKAMEVHPTCRPDTYVQDEAPLTQGLGDLFPALREFR